MQTQYDIFISYSDKDRELAQRVYEALKAEGLKCWIAFNDIPHGEVWAKAITQGIKNSKTFLLILSNNSNSSDQVLREIEYADKQKKKLYCYKVEELVVADAIDYFISSIQQYEAHGITFEKAMDRMLREFGKDLDIRQNSLEVNKISLDSQTLDDFYSTGFKLLDNHKYEEACEVFRKSGEAGEIGGFYMLGLINCGARNAKINYKEAMSWLLKAAALGHKDAKVQIGILYFEGLGFKQDYIEAMRWFTESLNGKGLNSNAEFYIGYMYHHGMGVKQDYLKAMEWYLKSTEWGGGTFAKAQNCIGVLYYNGNGVIQDKDIAKEWFIKSAKSWNESAINNLKSLYGITNY